jgi:hypothetical protein
MLAAMEDILTTLRNLSFTQMIFAWLFVGCYALAMGGMLGGSGSLRAGLAAAASGVLFAVFSEQWVHGALLVLFAIAGMGFFVAAAWLLATSSAWLIARRTLQPEPQPVAVAAPAAPQPAAGGLRALWRSLHLSSEA